MEKVIADGAPAPQGSFWRLLGASGALLEAAMKRLEASGVILGAFLVDFGTMAGE